MTTPVSTPLPPRCTIDHLPVELLHQIFFYLLPQDFDAARHVSRRWFQISLSRQLIHHHLAALVPSSACVCHGIPLLYCPAVIKASSDQDDESFVSIKDLRATFAQNLASWPGSRHRIACNRLELDTSAIRKYGGGVIEHVCFSRGGGTFVGIVTRIGGRKEAGRKLWVNRLFSFRHSTYGCRPRGPFGELCAKDVEVSRCIPGQLYMTMELTAAAEVMSVDIIEHHLFSGVKEIIVRFVNGQEKVARFTEFLPVKQSVRNHLGGEDTRFVDMGGHTYKVSSGAESTRGAVGTTAGATVSAPLKKVLQTLTPARRRKRKQKPGMEYILPEIPTRAAIPPLSTSPAERVLVQFPDSAEKQLCHSLTIPVAPPGLDPVMPSFSPSTVPTTSTRGYRLLLLPSQDLLITYIQSDIQGKAAISIAYRLKPPNRLNQGPGRVRHVTLSPSYFFDWGSRIWWACVVAAYENGEIWLWRIDTSRLEGTGSEVGIEEDIMGMKVEDGGGEKEAQTEKTADTNFASDAIPPLNSAITTTHSNPTFAMVAPGSLDNTLVAEASTYTAPVAEINPTAIEASSTTGTTSPGHTAPPPLELTLPPPAHVPGSTLGTRNIAPPTPYLSPQPSPNGSTYFTTAVDQSTSPCSRRLPSSSSATTTTPQSSPLPSIPVALSPSSITISSHLAKTIKTLHVDPSAAAIGAEPLLKDLQAWKVGWEPAPILKAEFVGKGQTLLIATEERVTVVEFRVRWGVERGVLRGRYG